MTDIVIIGGGIAGLYCGYKLINMRPDLKFVILEKDKRQETTERVSAGRLGSQMFEGIWISCGGGIGTNESKLLLKLLDELDIKHHWFEKYQKTDNPADAEWFKKVIGILRNNCPEMNGLTFYDFARKYLSYDDFTRLMYISGYRDYLMNDSYHVLNYYGLEDNANDYPAFSCNWGELVSALYRVIGESIHFEREVTQLKYVDDHQIVRCGDYKYVSKTIICATAIDGLLQLFDNHVYRSIAGQSCLRIYAKVKDYTDINKAMSGFQIVKVKNILQQMITINRQKRIFMPVYCDNLNADLLKTIMEPTQENKKIVGRLIDDAIQPYLDESKPTAIENMIGGYVDKFKPTEVEKMVGFYDENSIHIFKPLNIPLEEFAKKIQYPAHRVLVVGEVVSMQHGWVENALQSTDPLMSFLEEYFG